MSRPYRPPVPQSRVARDPGAVELYEALATMPRPWPSYMVEMYEAAVARAVSTGASYWVPEDTPPQVQGAARRAQPPGRRAWSAILRWSERAVRAWLDDHARVRPCRAVDPVSRVARQNAVDPVARVKAGVDAWSAHAADPEFAPKHDVTRGSRPRDVVADLADPGFAPKTGVDASSGDPAIVAKKPVEPTAGSTLSTETRPDPVPHPKTDVAPSPRVRDPRASRARRLSARVPQSQTGLDRCGSKEEDTRTPSPDTGKPVPAAPPEPTPPAPVVVEAVLPPLEPAQALPATPAPSEPRSASRAPESHVEYDDAPSQAEEDFGFLLDRCGCRKQLAVLRQCGIRTVEQLQAMTERQVMDLPGLGNKGMQALKRLAHLRFEPEPDVGYRPIDERQRFVYAQWVEARDAFGAATAAQVLDQRNGGRDCAAAEWLADRYLPRTSDDPVGEHGAAFRELMFAWLESRSHRLPARFYFAQDDLPTFEANRRNGEGRPRGRYQQADDDYISPTWRRMAQETPGQDAFLVRS